MQILEARSALLSNWEVYSLLQQQKDERVLHDKRTRTKTKICQNLCTIQFEICEYFSTASGNSYSIAQQSQEQIESLLRHFSSIALTKAEKLQILNLRPSSLLELHLIIEECEERFSQDQMEEILRAIELILPLPTDQKPRPLAASGEPSIQQSGSLIDFFDL